MLNDFNQQFKAQNKRQACESTPNTEEQVLHQAPADVIRMLSRVNPCKSAGPDNIPGRVLRDCADQLRDVLTDIFNISLDLAVLPVNFKKTTIIPVPKKSMVNYHNDYHPTAVTSIMMF